MAETVTRNRTETVARILVPVVAVSWFVAVFALSWHAFGLVLTFFGESPTPAETAESDRFWNAAAIVATVVPLAGLALAGIGRSRAGQVTFVVLLVLGLGFAVLVGRQPEADRRDVDPAPRNPVTGCQEHSGGDTRCPGG